jgi:hypothetical protein
MGDGVLIYFGYPVAHEEDAERAVRAALDVQRRLAEAREADGYPVHARIGIATGPVVVSDLASGEPDPERTLLGNALNLAARVQDFAGTDGIVVAALTRRLLGELFALEDLGVREIKGFDEPVAVFRVVAEAERLGRFAAQRAAVGLSRFVGRGWELDLLHDRWGHARAGDGQVVLISGEAGIGKSRLSRAAQSARTGQRRLAGAAVLYALPYQYAVSARGGGTHARRRHRQRHAGSRAAGAAAGAAGSRSTARIRPR